MKDKNEIRIKLIMATAMANHDLSGSTGMTYEQAIQYTLEWVLGELHEIPSFDILQEDMDL